jgi:hypothetical protein
MISRSPGEITAVLKAWSEGDETALENLTPLVHRELHRLARRYMSRVSSTLMRHILVRFARSRKYAKRRSGWLRG